MLPPYNWNIVESGIKHHKQIRKSMKIAETIYTPFKNDIFDLFWLYPAISEFWFQRKIAEIGLFVFVVVDILDNCWLLLLDFFLYNIPYLWTISVYTHLSILFVGMIFFQLFNQFQLFSSETKIRKLQDTVRTGQKCHFWKE
jgi:hypothetical protein